MRVGTGEAGRCVWGGGGRWGEGGYSVEGGGWGIWGMCAPTLRLCYAYSRAAPHVPLCTTHVPPSVLHAPLPGTAFSTTSVPLPAPHAPLPGTACTCMVLHMCFLVPHVHVRYHTCTSPISHPPAPSSTSCTPPSPLSPPGSRALADGSVSEAGQLCDISTGRQDAGRGGPPPPPPAPPPCLPPAGAPLTGPLSSSGRSSRSRGRAKGRATNGGVRGAPSPLLGRQRCRTGPLSHGPGPAGIGPGPSSRSGPQPPARGWTCTPQPHVVGHGVRSRRSWTGVSSVCTVGWLTARTLPGTAAVAVAVMQVLLKYQWPEWRWRQ